ncbi:MAG: preprotein translocase subunit SecG [Halieaceae bacterium]|nr:preprotein translocase subunit SecG [Halieaceae bacterium]
MEQLILIAHLLIAFAIIGLILLQQGKGAEMGASFGAGASQTLFGSTGSGNVLTRATAILATAFFLTSFGLAIIAKEGASPETELAIPLPAAEQEMPAMEATVPALESDLPVLEEDVPEAAVSADELPEVPENQ